MYKTLTLLFFVANTFLCFSVSFPKTGYTKTDYTEAELTMLLTGGSPVLGTQYDVTMGDGTNGTFQSTFKFVTPGSPDPGAWYTLADGSGLYEGDVIHFTDLNESYTLNPSQYENILWADGDGVALGSYSYFSEVPIGDGEIVFIFLCSIYMAYRMKKQIRDLYLKNAKTKV